MSGPMDLDQLLIEYEPEVGFKKPLGRSLTIPELKKIVAGKLFLDLGGKIMSETTLRQADKLIKEYDAICFRYVEQLIRKDMTVRRTMLGSLVAMPIASEGKPDRGQIYWAKDPTGNVTTLQETFDELDARGKSLVLISSSNVASNNNAGDMLLLFKAHPG